MQVPPPLAAAVMAAAVAEHRAIASNGPTTALLPQPPSGPPGPGVAQAVGEERAPNPPPADEDAVKALQRKVRKLTKRVAALEAARAHVSD